MTSEMEMDMGMAMAMELEKEKEKERDKDKEKEKEKEKEEERMSTYKVKVVRFLGRSVPIILQSDNGPCPLLAICNVLLLRNNVNISTDMKEISLQRLLSLVAEWLLDANSNVKDKDDDYVQNQQQNISDAIELLPRLATGLDVNVRFRHIHDFEFTPECAVFDLLDIGLAHGWLYDPQDESTSRVIGSDSYNTLVDKLVQSPANGMESHATSSLSKCVDIAEHLSENVSLGELEVPRLEPQQGRKGDAEEMSELLHALEESKEKTIHNEVPEEISPVSLESSETLQNGRGEETSAAPISPESTKVSDLNHPLSAIEGLDPNLSKKAALSDSGGMDSQSEIGGFQLKTAVSEEGHNDTAGIKTTESLCDDGGIGLQSELGGLHLETVVSEKERNSTTHISDPVEGSHTETTESSLCDDRGIESQSESGGLQPKAVDSEEECNNTIHINNFVENLQESEKGGLQQKVVISEEGGNGTSHISKSVDPETTESLCEGKPLIPEASASGFENRDALEQVILLEQNVKNKPSNIPEDLSEALSEGMVIKNFLSINASQLTYYGLFSLQEGLKDRELCVFFRNNHFSTMFKYNGDLYLLVTDQGYLNQLDLVWEKLHEVHGDSVFVTGNFTIFQADEDCGSWNEQEALASKSDFLSSQQTSGMGTQGGGNHKNSDFELAMALQQQEYDQQQQQQSRPLGSIREGRVQTRPEAGRLVTGPMRSSVPAKPEPKKDKCAIM